MAGFDPKVDSGDFGDRVVKVKLGTDGRGLPIPPLVIGIYSDETGARKSVLRVLTRQAPIELRYTAQRKLIGENERLTLYWCPVSTASRMIPPGIWPKLSLSPFTQRSGNYAKVNHGSAPSFFRSLVGKSSSSPTAAQEIEIRTVAGIMGCKCDSAFFDARQLLKPPESCGPSGTLLSPFCKQSKEYFENLRKENQCWQGTAPSKVTQYESDLPQELREAGGTTCRPLLFYHPHWPPLMHRNAGGKSVRSYHPTYYQHQIPQRHFY